MHVHPAPQTDTEANKITCCLCFGHILCHWTFVDILWCDKHDTYKRIILLLNVWCLSQQIFEIPFACTVLQKVKLGLGLGWWLWCPGDNHIITPLNQHVSMLLTQLTTLFGTLLFWQSEAELSLFDQVCANEGFDSDSLCSLHSSVHLWTSEL